MKACQNTGLTHTASFLQITGVTFVGVPNNFSATSRGQGVHSPPDGCLPAAIHDAP